MLGGRILEKVWETSAQLRFLSRGEISTGKTKPVLIRLRIKTGTKHNWIEYAKAYYCHAM